MKKKTTEKNNNKKQNTKKVINGPTSVYELPCSAISWREQHLSLCLFLVISKISKLNWISSVSPIYPSGTPIQLGQREEVHSNNCQPFSHWVLLKFTSWYGRNRFAIPTQMLFQTESITQTCQRKENIVWKVFRKINNCNYENNFEVYRSCYINNQTAT